MGDNGGKCHFRLRRQMLYPTELRAQPIDEEHPAANFRREILEGYTPPSMLFHELSNAAVHSIGNVLCEAEGRGQAH